MLQKQYRKVRKIECEEKTPGHQTEIRFLTGYANIGSKLQNMATNDKE